MLLTFSVANYRSIKEKQTLSLVSTALKGAHDPRAASVPGVSYGVLPCGIIYGPNASGKSNILKAFENMRHLVLSSHAQQIGRVGISRIPFMLDSNLEEEPTVFEVSFVVNGVRYDMDIKFNNDEIIEENLYSYPEGRRRKLYERIKENVDFGGEMKGSKKKLVEFMKKTSLFISTASQNKHPELYKISKFFARMFYSSSVSVESAIVDVVFARDEIDVRTIKFLEALGTGVVSYRQTSTEIPKDIRAMVMELTNVIGRHTDAEGKNSLPALEEKNYEIELAHRDVEGKEKFFPGDFESAGTRRLLIMMNNIFKVLDNGDIAIIDELDASLHSLAVEAIIKLFTDPDFNKNGAQLIATTHDTNLLNPEILRRDEIWFVEKQGDGSSIYYSLSEIVSRKGEVFEKSYLQGRYGALPPSFDKLAFEATQAAERPIKGK